MALRPLRGYPSSINSDTLVIARPAASIYRRQSPNCSTRGFELGNATDQVFDQKSSKQKSGSVGILTNDIIDRTQSYVDAVILALIPFKNQNLYFDETSPTRDDGGLWASIDTL